MHINGLLPRQLEVDDFGCLVCPTTIPPCECDYSKEECIRINRDCNNCAVNKCIPIPGSGGGGGGVSKGALAGGIVGVLLFLALVVGAYLWYRRTTRLQKEREGPQDFKDVPAPAEDVLNRPDPIEKPVAPTYSEPRSVGLDPTIRTETSPSFNPHYDHVRNPFDDANSIQTAASEGTNVIPIALVPADGHEGRPDGDSNVSGGSNGPIRPPRSPDLNLNLEHVNVSGDNLRAGNGYAPSTISGISSTNRHSYMSNMTSASEMLNEAPMIMTPMKGSVRQVLGVVKAEVISAGSLHSSPSSDTLRPPTFSRPAVTSPLAATSFGPSDVVPEADESQDANPFSDKHSSTHADYGASPPPTATTYGQASTRARESTSTSNWITPDMPQSLWVQGAHDDGMSRPSSMATQAGSIIDIASARRVNVGLATPGTASTAKTYRTTMGRLVSPSSAGASVGTLEEQQARALAHAQAQAQAQGLDKPRPVSGSSAISATADSILESFPFVPPSPISNRPLRSPPVSPLAQQSFTNNSTSPLGQHTFTVAPPSPLSGDRFSQNTTSTPAGSGDADDESLPAPPNRRTLGLSTGSQLSTASSGLGSFPFQIDSGADVADPPPPAYRGRQRASLDTLALTSDLSSYPLGFDRENTPVPPRNPRK
ncbi:hypothetical protein CC1G_00283 [Coprinopsis cinerea okayama7|uniref:Membrane anchor Opy2 N-terminal domain-containing protein n=1 Tax=Coprinopsis cinerea (strain Okayama-7 / 130 / ATCC MYA-4618 / FGSC 9003) TaxID=240176 RepID=A8NXE8_COPC7|nr:hypothetical protein CC1G_00283 [Coprinopsis cinerea okayama7\|eukprot:XP_001837147.1 hypothetical protein CC1G_00283 [Coprinopsis cinerea okayama7\